MSTNASSSKPVPNSLKLDEQTTEQQPAQSKVSGLEEDDEFEEFTVQGERYILGPHFSLLLTILAGCWNLNLHGTIWSRWLYDGSKTDWDDSHTDLAHLGGAPPGAAKSGGDKLWEDNWDDDDVEDEFSVQLR